MARINNLTDFLSDVADAIRTKKGTEEKIAASDFDTEIENLPSGGGDYNVKIDTTKSYNGSYGIQSLITELKEIDTSNMTSTKSMFLGCQHLLTIPQIDTKYVTDMSIMFQLCSNIKNIPPLRIDRATNFSNMFNQCTNLERVVFVSENIRNVENVSQMFNFCKKMNYVDLRYFDFSQITSQSKYSNMFGAGADYGVPDDCEIIVADDTAKTWITSKFTRLTNVKTVAEYEAEQNA